MAGEFWTAKQLAPGDTETIAVTTTTAIPTGASVTLTLYEDVENDGTGPNTDALGNAYDTAASATLSGGADETTALSGFDGGGTENAYWLRIEFGGDGADPTLDAPTLDSVDVTTTVAGATASITPGQDADRSSADGIRGAVGTVSGADADRSSVAGTRQAVGRVSAADADRSISSGVRLVRGHVTAQDADRSAIAGVRGVIGHVSARDADRGSVTGLRSVVGAVSAADADRSVVAGETVLTDAATIIRGFPLTLAWTETRTRTLPWAATYERTFPLMADDIEPPDDYVAGESAILTGTVTDAGSTKDLTGASVDWYLLPAQGADMSDVLLDTSAEGVTANITDPAAGEVEITIDQGVTDGLAGRNCWQLLVVDDGGGGRQKWRGNWYIEAP